MTERLTHPTHYTGIQVTDEVTDTFTHLCVICGMTVSVVEGRSVPHRCRIVIGESVTT